MHSKGVIFKLRFQFAESGRWEQKRKKKICILKTIIGEFPSSPMIKPQCFHWVGSWVQVLGLGFKPCLSN